MGSAAAWRLARAGRSVLLLERFTQVHLNGSSHGPSRNFNMASYTEGDYLDLVAEAGRIWHELEDETGERLLDVVGLVDHGAGEFDGHDELLRAHGFQAETLRPEEAHERWPGIRFDTRVLHAPEGGRLNPDRAIPAMQAAAARHDAVLRHETPVRAIEPFDDGSGVRVVTDAGSATAHTVIVTAGAWARVLLDGLVDLPPLRVTQEQPAHFALADGGDGLDPATQERWPGFNHIPAPGDARTAWWRGEVYGMLTPGEGVKVGWHGAGPVVDPDHRDFAPEPAQMDDLRRYVREWLPGVVVYRQLIGSNRSGSAPGSAGTGSSSPRRSGGCWPSWRRIPTPVPCRGSRWGASACRSASASARCGGSLPPPLYATAHSVRRPAPDLDGAPGVAPVISRDVAVLGRRARGLGVQSRTATDDYAGPEPAIREERP